ncbi:TAP-like protein-domain-containing protein [Fusarium solani]|uniref:TAP-like protein-domain-containing protein n=1 Tax=Fusarium solani TaxID=169388 RepID=A0A9P9GVG1_FUSSL|nr:TAP-like protein-domain-containing protein [Fusarium solani]KAH7244882.1 TAP-like protein-domain-containing protein [Fusarium solani]
MLKQEPPMAEQMRSRVWVFKRRDVIAVPRKIVSNVEFTQCAKLKVPLDYTDPDNKKEVALDLTKIEALKKPSKGSILINFGGPGEPARASLTLNSAALKLLGLTGGEYGLIGFDPRGTGDTLTFSCFDTDLERTQFTNGEFKFVAGAFPLARGQNWASSEIFAETRALKQNKTGQFLGTSFVARDMMQIVDALDEDGMLRYWGMSYGIYLGAVAANMFPDKIDKMMLDAVVNPFDWRINHDFESLVDTDATFSRFCQECVEARDICPLAGKFNAKDLEKKLYKFFDDLRLAHRVSGHNNRLQVDQGVAIMSRLLNAMMKRDPKLLEAALTQMSEGGGGGGSGVTKESLWGIRCSDMTEQTDDIHDIIPILNKRWDTSRFAADTIEDVVMRCSRWKLPAKEPYEGDFKAKTKNPVLVIGQTADPITPLASARNLTGTLEGSVLLEFDIPGHSILRRRSECVIKATAAYWSEGKLPKNNTVCKSEVEPFSTDSGWPEMIKELGMGPKE